MADEPTSRGMGGALTVLQSTPQVVPAQKFSIRTVWVTAYASVPEETDDTPFETASGSTVHDGVMAANFLPFGTKVQIPSLFGNKVFTVEDRLHPRKKGVVDIWMATPEAARDFGVYKTEIAVLN